jgi:hypothetical protein
MRTSAISEAAAMAHVGETLLKQTKTVFKERTGKISA